MQNLEIRKIIALAIAGAYIIFSGYGLLFEKQVPSEFIGTVGMILGYYYGKATALDIPGDKGGDPNNI